MFNATKLTGALCSVGEENEHLELKYLLFSLVNKQDVLRGKEGPQDTV